MKQLDKKHLLALLDLYDSITEKLQALNDPGVNGLIQRIAWHRAEVVRALAAQNAA